MILYDIYEYNVFLILNIGPFFSFSGILSKAPGQGYGRGLLSETGA